MSDTDKKILRKGIIGTVIAALCCFTPFLVILFGAVGISAWLGWVDYVLFPVLFASLGLVAQALYLRAGKIGSSPKGYIFAAVIVLSALIFWLEFKFALGISLAAAATVAAYAYFLRSQAARHASALKDDNKMEQQS